MHENGKTITDSSTIMEILIHCRDDHTVFGAVDEQDNFYSLGLEAIETKPAPEDTVFDHHCADPIQAVFRPLQQGASEMRMDCNYSFCFQHLGNAYSFLGKLLRADPDKFVLTYLLYKKIFRRPLRQSKRLTIDTPDKVFAKIGDRTYRLINASVGGVGIMVEERDAFKIGQFLRVKLVSEDLVFEAGGCVRHVAPLPGDAYIFGFSLIYEDAKSIDLIRRFIHRTRLNRSCLCRRNMFLR
jgi:hypothetical protein